MKAAVIYGKKDLRIEDIDLPEVTEGKVKVEIGWGGICGTDIAIYHHGLGLADEEHPLSGRKPPLVLGHEFSGTVTEVGENVTNLKVGDRVSVEPLLYCGNCEMCKRGHYHLCEISNTGSLGVNDDGGFAEYIVTEAHRMHKLPENMTLEEGALIEPTAVALHAVHRSGLKAGQTTAIFGAGPIGLLTLLSAKAAGASDIIITDVSDERLEKAKELGATFTFNPMNENVEDKIMEVTSGKGVDVAFEAAGAQPTFNNAVNTVKRAGTITVVAVFGEEVNLDTYTMFLKEANMIWSHTYPNTFGEAIRMIASKRIDAAQVITKKMKLDELEEGLELLVEDKSQSKILVRPN